MQGQLIEQTEAASARKELTIRCRFTAVSTGPGPSAYASKEHHAGDKSTGMELYL